MHKFRAKYLTQISHPHSSYASRSRDFRIRHAFIRIRRKKPTTELSLQTEKSETDNYELCIDNKLSIKKISNGKYKSKVQALFARRS